MLRIFALDYYTFFTKGIRDKLVPVTPAWPVLKSRLDERPLDVEGRCEYIEQAVADIRQGVIFQLGSWASCYKHSSP